LANRLVSYFRSRSPTKDTGRLPETGQFIRPTGVGYLDFFRRIHETYLFDWYMEIGCRTGTIVSQARGKTIAIDPYFQVTRNVIGPKSQLHFFQAKSDDFFSTEFLEKNQIQLSFSFLDGMHLFEFLLRDFINTERNSHPDGVIAIHDCCPTNAAMTTRDLNNLPEGAWTGDVWKILPILQQYRPDLKITVLDCMSTGLVLVSGLEPGNRALSENYDDIIKAYRGVDLNSFGVGRFFGSFRYADADAFLKAGAPMIARVAIYPGNALKPVKISP
jgi:hypothetical protein